MPLLDRITVDLNVMGAKPCIRGMRVTSGTVLGLLAAGRTEEEILDAYPYLGTGRHQSSSSLGDMAPPEPLTASHYEELRDRWAG